MMYASQPRRAHERAPAPMVAVTRGAEASTPTVPPLPVGEGLGEGAANQRGGVCVTQQDVMALRDLHASDERGIQHILDTSEYVHFHFDLDQLSRLVERFPAVGAFSVPAGPLGRVSGGTLQAFLLINWLAPPSAWLGGFGVTWSQGERFEEYLDPLLEQIIRRVAAHGAQSLYYSGGDIDNDWLGDSLAKRGF